jgi:hypothetical protein
VEYAMAPANALVDDQCRPRTASQEQLTAWLQYVTGPGQQQSPPGIVPLTAGLRAEAGQAIARVGATPTTCVTVPPPTTPGSSPTTALPPAQIPTTLPPDFGSAGFGSSGFESDGFGADSGLGSGAAGGSAIAPSSPEELAGANELAEAARPTLPEFLGVKAVSEVISPAALLLLVALTAAAAYVTSGRPLPTPVARAPGQAAALTRRAIGGTGRAARRLPRLVRRAP